MRGKRKSVVFAALVLAAVLLSVLLPHRIQAYKDHLMFGKMHLRDAPLAEKQRITSLSTLDKLQLLFSEKTTGVSTGNHYSADRVKEQCTKELKLLYEKNVLDYDPSEKVWSEQTADAALLLSSQDWKQAMLLWTVTFSSNTAYIRCGIDDETGKILCFYIADFENEKDKQESRMDDQMQAFIQYLGVEKVLWKKLFTTVVESEEMEGIDQFYRGYQYPLEAKEGTVLYPMATTKYGCLFGYGAIPSVK